MKTPRFYQFSQTILFVCLAASIIFYLTIGIASVAFPYGLEYGEAPVLDQAKRAATGQQQYKSELGQPPYTIDNYPPLYPLLIGGISAITNLPLLQAGRAVSILAGLLAGLLVGTFVLRLSRRRFAAALAAGLFLSNLFVLVWAPLARVDTLALALSLTGLWLIYCKWRSPYWLSLATICLVAAVYTRPTYALAAPVAATIWLWHNDRRKSVLFGGVFLAACASLLLVLNAVTFGGFYLHTVLFYASHGYRLGRVATLLTGLFSAWPLAVTIAGIELVGAFLRFPRSTDEDQSPAHQPFVVYGLVPYTIGALIAALAAGKVGSDVNYLLELIATLAIWVGVAVAWWPQHRHLGPRSVPILLTMQLLLSLLLGWSVVGVGLLNTWRRLGKFDRVFARVQVAVQQGPVLADDYLGMVVLAGQPVYYQPFDYLQLYTAGKWDASPLIDEIKARRFPLILLSRRGSRVFDERWIPAVVEAIDTSYCPSESVDDLVLYVPSTAPCTTKP